MGDSPTIFSSVPVLGSRALHLTESLNSAEEDPESRILVRFCRLATKFDESFYYCNIILFSNPELCYDAQK